MAGACPGIVMRRPGRNSHRGSRGLCRTRVNREQFGRPIGSFQAVQQLCADQLVNVEGCRSITWQAAWGVDALEPDRALSLSRVAKAHCSEVGRTVCESAIQVWGGLGMTWDCPAHRYLRRALLDRQLFGDERVQLAAIADERLGPSVGDPH